MATQMKSWFWIILFCCLLALTQAVSAAVEWSFAPSLRAGLVYNDNIRLTTREHDAVWGRQVGPKLDLQAKTRMSETRLGAELIYTNYTGNEVNNRNLQRFTLLSRYQQTPRSRWQLNGRLNRDTVLTPISGGSGDLPPESGGATDSDDAIPDPDQGDDNDARRNRLRLTPSWTRRLSQRSSLILDYTLYDVTYVGDSGQSTLVDNDTQSVRVTLDRNMTRRTQVGIIGRYAEYEASDADATTTNYSLTGKIDHDFSKTLSSSIELGMRNTDSRRGSRENQSTNSVFRARLTQNVFEASRYQLLLERRLLPTSTGSVVESDRIDLRFQHRIKPTLTFSLSGRYFRNETLEGGGTSSRDRWYYYIRPALTKKLTRNWAVDSSYRYRRQKRKTDNQSADSNAVYLNVTYAWLLR